MIGRITNNVQQYYFRCTVTSSIAGIHFWKLNVHFYHSTQFSDLWPSAFRVDWPGPRECWPSASAPFQSPGGRAKLPLLLPRVAAHTQQHNPQCIHCWATVVCVGQWSRDPTPCHPTLWLSEWALSCTPWLVKSATYSSIALQSVDSVSVSVAMLCYPCVHA